MGWQGDREDGMGQAFEDDGIRRLRPQDLPSFRAHMLRLDGASRVSRFAMSVSDGFLVRYVEQSFAPTAEASGVLLFGHFRAGEIRGAAELRPIARREAEAAFSVEPLCRGRGIGTALFSRLLDAARQRRLKRLYMSCLARNRAMQALARKFEAELILEATDVLGIVERESVPAGDVAHQRGRPGSVARDGWGDPTSLADDPTREMPAGFATAILDLQAGWFRLPRRRDRQAP
jgi:GNAT superfamily N-acetyltransferase